MATKRKNINMWREFGEFTNVPFRPIADEIPIAATETMVDPKKLLEVSVFAAKERDKCDVCGELVGISDEGFYICTNIKCGTIYNDVLNFAPEWRSYPDDQQSSDPTRCSIPNDPLFEESATSCKMMYGTHMSVEMRKIQCQLTWAVSYKEKSQYDDYQHIIAIANQHGIVRKITNDAFIYYKKIFDSKNSFRGENRDSIIAASIYISCRINNNPRTAKEIAEIFNLNTSAATKGCKKAIGIINLLEKEYEYIDKTVYCTSQPTLFIERYCNKLGIPNELTLLCEFVCLKLEYLNVLTENTPQAIAAGVVYFIGFLFKLNITKAMIKKEIDLSEVTITKCYKKIDVIRESLVPPMIAAKYGITV